MKYKLDGVEQILTDLAVHVDENHVSKLESEPESRWIRDIYGEAIDLAIMEVLMWHREEMEKLRQSLQAE